MTKIAIALMLAVTGCAPNNGTCVRPKDEFPNCSANVRESGCSAGPKYEAKFFDESRAAGRLRCHLLGYTEHATKTPEFDIFYLPRDHGPFLPPPPKPFRLR